MRGVTLNQGDSLDANAGISWSDIEAGYQTMLGHIPDGLTVRRRVFGEEGLLFGVELLRMRALTPAHLESRLVQLLQFAIYSALRNQSGADSHARAAIKAGATGNELIDVAGIVWVAQGMPAYTVSARAIDAIEDR